MPTFEITGPDGKKYHVTGENADGALAALKKSLAVEPARSAPQQVEAAGEQFGIGANTGIASMLGLPMDAISAWGRGSLGMPGGDMPGGSASMQEMFRGQGLIKDKDPANEIERRARTAGEYTGPALVGGAVGGGMGLAGASGLASGAAAGEVREEGGSPLIEALVAALAGGGTVLGKYAMRKGPQAPAIEGLKAEREAAYDAVKADDGTISPDAMGRLRGSVADRMQESELDDLMHPKATRAVEKLGELEEPRVYKLEQRRQFIGRDVAGASDAGERALGKDLKDEIDDFLGSLGPDDVRGGADPEGLVQNLQTGRERHQRIKRADMLAETRDKAERQAAVSGTGGNEINATRQKLNAILNDPRKKRQFTPEQQEVIEAIARGDATTNTSRLFARLAPTSGALPFMATGWGGLAASTATGSALPMVPGTIGFIAKAIGESLTRSQVKKLEQMVLNNGPVDPKRLSDAERAVLAALTASQGAKAEQQQ